MSWTLSQKLYAALAASAVLVLAGTAVTFQEVNNLGDLSARASLQTLFVEKINLQLFYQAAALAALRGHALEASPDEKAKFISDINREQSLAVEVESLLSQAKTDLENYRRWRGLFLRWKAEIADPYFEAIARGQKKVLPAKHILLHRDILAGFELLMVPQVQMDRTLSDEEVATRAFAKNATLICAVASIGFGALIFLVTLRRVTAEVQEAVVATTAGTTEIAATLTQQEHIATDQATAINQISSTMTELTATSVQATESSEAIVQRSSASMGTVRQWGDGLRANVEDMGTLRDTVEGIAHQIQELSEQTAQIGGILGTVSDVAGQTNLLALNAAVEAARAGEHGRGFAVVASEIRKLADQSKRSLERIGSIVTQIQKATNATVMAAEQGTKRVEVTIRTAQDSMGAVQSIVSTLEDTVLNTQQITLNLRQQGVGIRQVSEAIGSINAGTKENLAGMGQVRLGINQLKDMGNRLQRLVGE